MRCRFAQILVLLTVCVPARCLPMKPEISQSTGTQIEPRCPAASTSDGHEHPALEVSIAEISFSGFLQMPNSDQDQIAASIKQLPHGSSVDEVVGEALERTRTGWQDRGYFNVKVRGDARVLTSSPVSQQIALEVQVDEGPQYRLGKISWISQSAQSLPKLWVHQPDLLPQYQIRSVQ